MFPADGAFSACFAVPGRERAFSSSFDSAGAVPVFLSSDVLAPWRAAVPEMDMRALDFFRRASISARRASREASSSLALPTVCFLGLGQTR